MEVKSGCSRVNYFPFRSLIFSMYVPWVRAFAILVWPYGWGFEHHFWPGGWELIWPTENSKCVMSEGLPGGMLKFQIDCYINSDCVVFYNVGGFSVNFIYAFPGLFSPPPPPPQALPGVFHVAPFVSFLLGAFHLTCRKKLIQVAMNCLMQCKWNLCGFYHVCLGLFGTEYSPCISYASFLTFTGGWHSE